MKCFSCEKTITSAIEAVQTVQKTCFKHKTMLLLVLPVNTASLESFSTLMRLKTYLRNRIGEDRLVGLVLMTVHGNIKVLILIKTNLLKKNRNLKF